MEVIGDKPSVIPHNFFDTFALLRNSLCLIRGGYTENYTVLCCDGEIANLVHFSLALLRYVEMRYFERIRMK